MISPFTKCPTVGCKDHGKLLGGHRKGYMAYMYTLRRGVLPVWVITLYCSGMWFSSVMSSSGGFEHTSSLLIC